MANLDEMSVMLGEIRSDLKHVLNWQKDHEIADQQRFEALAVRIDKNNGHAGRIDALEIRATKVEVVADNIKKAGWMTRGFFLGLSLIGGVVGATALQIAKWL